VIGVDLRNEPHNATGGGSCWGCGGPTDWALAAARGGNAVLAVNPNLLIFVEGTDCYNNDCDWWGGNLEGVLSNPVTLNVPGQLAYSAHDYGPNLSGQSWFNDSTTYVSLIGNFTKFWGYVSLNGIAPVWIGEFGTDNNDADVVNTVAGSQGQWFSSLITFLQANPQLSWTYWALNGEDSYALLDPNYDLTPADALKQQELASIQFGNTVTGGATCTQIAPVPENVTPTAGGPNQILLGWSPVTATVLCAVTYNIYASTSPTFDLTAANRLGTGTPSTSYIASGLQPSTTYYFAVTAVDSAGESNGTAPVTATTTPGDSGSVISCQVTYTLSSQWDVGFNGSVTIQNNGTSDINGWILSWTWPGSQQMYEAWNSNYTNIGSSVVLTNAPWNATIPAGSNVGGVGFLGNYSGTNVSPATFYLNGALCNDPSPASMNTPPNRLARKVSASQISPVSFR
jgi:endoglucanase